MNHYQTINPEAFQEEYEGEQRTINDIIREYDESHDDEINCTSHCEGCIDTCEHYINANFVDNWIDAHR